MKRPEMLELVAQRILAVQREHPLRVAIDGIDAAGKTTLADELAALMQPHRPIIRASVDSFHQPREVRYQRGPDSPEGYYHDSFDYAALKTDLLEPLGPSGNRNYRAAHFDYRTDAPTRPPLRKAPDHAILLLDGVFLLRPELHDWWDFAVFVQVSFSTALGRALIRDQIQLGSSVRQRYEKRYLPGQQLYLDTVHPQQYADIVVDNNDPLNPFLI